MFDSLLAESQRVSFDGALELDLSQITSPVPGRLVGDDNASYLMAIRLEVPDREVERWEPLQYAFGTDGGLGGFTTTDNLGRTPDAPPGNRFEIKFDSALNLLDLDGRDGDETFVWGTGGAGGFPITVGRDNEGRAAALLFWNYDQPWRVVIGDGIPPADITQREEELFECMNGTRGSTADGYCEADDLTR